ncbi:MULTISPECIES: flagellin [unclassified Salipiger]|uniref:flagellin N-terminal helical domain-containing protein n=1 Tax=unclassified Salipiger TaxID=2640570 RepID=UPI0013B8A76F|nr:MULTISPECIES: flagellin [unclassified Salipiger]NDV53540.1 flagellar protein [Salipiger sp. PrR003]NDW35058.1 flagellar protein [Salipiger sp. PrR007]
MSSINTNASAMNALSTLRNINKQLEDTQGRISTGLKVESGKDNASYFQISTTMNSESGMYSAINEGMTLAKSSVSTARLGAETLVDLTQQFVDRLAFAQEEGVDQAAVGEELAALVAQMETTIGQSSFNGENLISTAGTTELNGGTPLTTATSIDKTVTTGISRDGADLSTTKQSFTMIDLELLVTDGTDAAGGTATLKAIAASVSAEDYGTGTETIEDHLTAAEGLLTTITKQATSLGVAEKAIETQQSFLNELTDRISTGVSAMVDADMEEEAARLQALQVQQQLATQSLSIANSAPQNILSLFR